MKNTSKKTLLGLLVAAALSVPSMVVLAQATEYPFTQEQFDQLDIDKDGRVTVNEYLQFMEGAFSRLDADGNGYITYVDVESVLTPEQFAEMDTDKTGQVSRKEFMDQVLRDFHRHDRNGDGSLSYP